MDRRDLGSTELERALTALAPHVAFPPEPDLTRAVRSAIEAGPARARRSRPPTRRLFAFAVTLLGIAGFAVLSLSPAARDAVADFLGIGGIRIGHGSTPRPTASPGDNLALGSPTTLSAAAAQVDFHVLVPDDEAASTPDAVYFASVPVGGRVSLVYEPSAFLPAAPETRLGMIVTEFEATLDADAGKKLLGDTATVTPTDVDGHLAYWIRGPHTFFYRDSRGEVRTETLRFAGNTLLWEQDGVTVRIESALDLDTARRIAESMR